MVGVKDKTILCEIAKWNGMVPLRVETGEYPVCFNRIVTSVYNLRGPNGSKTNRLHQIRVLLCNGGYVYWRKENDMIILMAKGWRVADGKK